MVRKQKVFVDELEAAPHEFEAAQQIAEGTPAEVFRNFLKTVEDNRDDTYVAAPLWCACTLLF